jgi:hypothetical protein
MPGGARLDVTQSSCPTSVLLCVTASESPRRLISDLRSTLGGRGGASFGASQCLTARATLLGGVTCDPQRSTSGSALLLDHERERARSPRLARR